MNTDHVYVLIHSPLVGSLTWTLVADEMRRSGLKVIVPFLNDSPDSKESFWKQHTDSVAQSLKDISKDEAVTLVAHSGAGPLLPVIRESISNKVNAYVFVDAGLPRDGASRLDLMREENFQWAEQFQAELERGERFPNWSSEDLRDIVPDENIRNLLIADLRPRALDFFTEPIPVFRGWPDAPYIYILFSETYKGAEAHARQAGWQTYTLDAGHFHMLVDAPAVTKIIVEAINRLEKD